MGDRLRDKRAIVTGAAGAIGGAIVARFLSEGARVVATDVVLPDDQHAIALTHDVRNGDAWDSVFTAARQAFGGVDILINNAGVSIAPGEAQDIESVSIDQWRWVQAVNVEGTLLGCQRAIQAMKDSGGAIVNVSSLAALNPSPKLVAYGASKAAVRHLTRSVAAHCAERGYPIRCNSIHPGWVLTPLVQATRTPEELDAQRQRIPLRRFAAAEEIAAAILYLSSDEASYMTGAKMVVDGGIIGE